MPCKSVKGSVRNFNKICANNSWKYPLVALLRIISVEESNGATISGGRIEFQRRVGAVSPQLILGCRWYALLLAGSVNTQLALCGAGSGALGVTGRRLIAMAGDL
jgi:hypothetical protein